MKDFIFNNLDIILCVGLCLFHLIIGIISAIFQNKKIEKICKLCGSPIFKGEEHTCSLTYEELSALVAFVKDFKGDNENGNK